jgi:hypothetical protein
VVFLQHYLVEAQAADGSTLAFASFANLNAMLGSGLRPAVVSVSDTPSPPPPSPSSSPHTIDPPPPSSSSAYDHQHMIITHHRTPSHAIAHTPLSLSHTHIHTEV